MRTLGTARTGTPPPPATSAAPPPAAHEERFADPFTRHLLGHTGSTTEQLRRRTGAPLRLRLVSQHTVPPADGDAPRPGSPTVRRPADTPCLVRVTELLTPDGITVSRNLVTGPLPAAPAVADAVTRADTPLGPALARAGVRQRRTLLGVGLAPWPQAPTGPPAVRRAYLLYLADEPPLRVVERFNPAVVPSGTHPGSPARPWPVRA
ncbi:MULTISPECIES: chorismate--pyruvate lyase family protein [unclassified Streptomyces]|uniref:chorismate--pyruvate lyase family protein n=1 Tax=unclassified Streptomyces TaxID=2593676 RepID=UPI0022B63DD2|nr:MULTISPECIES: hypothetical protein [unclassified Streptomyces]MCZ7416815.1 hypothetical protein [Streptomyces sp. WMMC897]MCZ7433375.1 hypothetical protein [Streptomyces sp. WMMC1477]